jgi:hypothetical protein
VMRALYGRGFQARYRSLSALIEPDADVFEVCAGDAYLYERYLGPRGIRYRGGDLNPAFVRHAQRRGVPLSLLDLREDEVPAADYVVIQASLYQFMPDERALIDKLLRSARRMLLVAEPIRNLSSSGPRVLRWLAQRSADPGDGHKATRFDERGLDALFQTHYRDRIAHVAVTPGGREKIYGLRGAA